MFTAHMAPRELANFRWMVQRRPSSTRSKMRWELASILFHSCRRISSKQSRKQSPPTETDDRLLREPRQMRDFPYRKWQGENRSRLSHGKIVGCSAAGTGVDRHEGRLRRRRVRFLLCLDER